MRGNPANQLTVQSLGRDQVLGFAPGNWIEILDDSTEFGQTHGELHQIDTIDFAAKTITLATALGADFPAGNPDPSLHTRIRRWDQSGKVYEQDGTTVWWDIDAQGSADIPVPPSGTWLILENGITVGFDLTLTTGGFNTGDFWTFAARTATGQVEKLDQAAPRGIHHHYARLSIVTFGNPATDCRHRWPPDFGEPCCDCTVCVTADSHNAGGPVGTLQWAVNQVTAKGGKICLGPGIYSIASPVVIANGNNIEISGHGLPNLVASSSLTSQQPIFEIDGCVNINIEDIAFTGPVIGVAISNNSWFTRIKRCLFTGVGESSPMSLGVGFSGGVANAQVQDCFFNNVQIGVGPAPGEAQETFVLHLSIQNNEMLCTTAGFSFEANSTFVPIFLEVFFSDNLVTAPIGFQFGGHGLDIAIERNSFTLIASPTGTLVTANAAIVCAGSQVRISDNQIFGDPNSPGLDGIVLAGQVMYGTQVTSNRVDNLADNGLLVKKHTILLETIISENQLLNLGGPGIQMESGSFAIDLNVTGNSMGFVGLTTTASGLLGGIVLQGIVLNANIIGNSLEAIGPNTTLNASRVGLAMIFGADVRIAGNRVLDIGPQGPVNVSVGIFPFAVLGRLAVNDNEVRRASVPQMNGDTSQWAALLIGVVLGDITIRGNLLEAFGSMAAVTVLISRSCIFANNQVFLDNPVAPSSSTLAVELGVQINNQSYGGAIIASNNFVQTPVPLEQTGFFSQVMTLNPKDKDKTLTVLGNITSGAIYVNGAPLDPKLGPPLNVVNV